MAYSSEGQRVKTLQNPPIKINELSVLNSESRETNLSISPDGKYLFFMSDRGGQTWSSLNGTYKGKPRYDGDIWYSVKRNGEWGKPRCLGRNVNTYSGEDEPNVAPDGQSVIFQSWRDWWEETGGPYYQSTLNGDYWGDPVGLGGGITKFFSDKMNKYYGYATDGMSVSPDRKTFIVACGRHYDGNMDLYISHYGENGWTYLKELSLSTRDDERSVFIAADNRTIYFASNGYGGFGGLDIFKATLNADGSVSNIVNIGEPFNTAQDDYGFIITADGKEAYFVREGDIYYASLPENSEIAPGASVEISGVVKDCNNNYLEVNLYLKDSNGNELAISKSSNLGEFAFSITEKSGEYSIFDEKNNLLETVTVKATGKYQKIKVNLKDCYNLYPAKQSACEH